MRQPRRGFTLIEILIVIGIIMLLIGLLVVGFRHINATAARRETVAELKTLRAMLTEYENHAGLQGIANSGTALAYGDFDTNNTTDMSDRSGAANPRYASNAVKATLLVMNRLLQVPANRTEVQNLPTKRILEAAPGAAAPPTLDQAVILDGWGNPIIFVPAGGISVKVDANDYIVRTSGTFLASALKNHPLTSADRPFFASAGQDGSFATSDPSVNPPVSNGGDNVYSFQE